GISQPAEQNIGEAHDARERAANLMAHIGEKFILALAELFQSLLGLVNLADVRRAADVGAQLSRSVENGGAARLQPTPLAVAASQARALMKCLAGLQRFPKGRNEPVPVVG